MLGHPLLLWEGERDDDGDCDDYSDKDHIDNSHLTTKPHIFDIKCQSNSRRYDQLFFFRTKFRRGKLFIYVGGFPNERECSGDDLLETLIDIQI